MARHSNYQPYEELTVRYKDPITGKQLSTNFHELQLIRIQGLAEINKHLAMEYISERSEVKRFDTAEACLEQLRTEGWISYE